MNFTYIFIGLYSIFLGKASATKMSVSKGCIAGMNHCCQCPAFPRRRSCFVHCEVCIRAMWIFYQLRDDLTSKMFFVSLSCIMSRDSAVTKRERLMPDWLHNFINMTFWFPNSRRSPIRWWLHYHFISNASLRISSGVLGSQASWIFLLGKHFVQGSINGGKSRWREGVGICISLLGLP